MHNNNFRYIILGGFIILVSSLFYYQIIKGQYFLDRAKNNYLKALPFVATRGSIYDRNDLLLAYDHASFNLSVIPYEIKNKKEILFKELSEFLDYDINRIHKNYKNKLHNKFTPVDIVLNLDKMKALEAKEKFKDIILNPYPKRYYPYPFECAHLLGYLRDKDNLLNDRKSNKSGYDENKTIDEIFSFDILEKYGYHPSHRQGVGGIEEYYDNHLNGKAGGRLIEVDAKGKMVGFLGERKSEKGKDINLTIDYSIQQIAYETLKEKKGTIILMDSIDGEIISLVSFPSFNPNYFIEGKNVNLFLSDKEAPMLNRAIQSTYPLGSVFKPIIAAASLEEHKIKNSTTFSCNGEFNISGRTFKCSNVHLDENIYDALAHSCNVYFYNAGNILGGEFIGKWGKTFGFDRVTGIDIPYETKGLIPSSNWKSKNLKTPWFAGDTINLSIGQGYMKVSPIETLAAINVFANGGYLVTPHIIKSIEEIEINSFPKIALGISKNNLGIIRQGLKEVVNREDGTAYFLKNLNLSIAGKTGTAQNKDKPHGWFVGFFPYNKPKYSICVFLENAGSGFEAVKAAYNFLEKLKEKNLL